MLFHSWIHTGILLSTVSQFKGNNITEESRIPWKMHIGKIRAWLLRNETNGLMKIKSHWRVPVRWLNFWIYRRDYPSKSVIDFYVEHWIKKLILKSHRLCVIMRNTFRHTIESEIWWLSGFCLVRTWRIFIKNFQNSEQIAWLWVKHNQELLSLCTPTKREISQHLLRWIHTQRKRLYQHSLQVGNRLAFWKNNSWFAFHFPNHILSPF